MIASPQDDEAARARLKALAAHNEITDLISRQGVGKVAVSGLRVGDTPVRVG